MQKNLLFLWITGFDTALVKEAIKRGYRVHATSGSVHDEEFRFLEKLFPEIQLHDFSEINSKYLNRNIFLKEYFEKVSQLITDHEISFIFPTVGTSGYLFDVLEEIRKKLGIQVFKKEHSEIFKSKLSYFEKLKDKIKIPQLYNSPPSEDDDYPCICKPDLGVAGVGVYLCKDKNETDKFLALDDQGVFGKKESMGGSYLIQKYIEGKVISFSGAISKKGFHLVIAFEIEVGKGKTRPEKGFYWPIIENKNATEKRIQKIGDEICKVLSLASGGLMGDLILTKEGELYLIDLGPRANQQGLMICDFLQERNELARLLFDSFEGREIEEVSKFPNFSLVYKNLDLPTGSIESVEFTDSFSNDVIDHHIPIKSGDKIEESLNDYHEEMRGFIAVRAKSRVEGLEKWKFESNKVKIKYKNK